MATSAATLTQRIRRYVRDWPAYDNLTASLSSGATTVTVADSTLYGVGKIIEVDQEAMYVNATPLATTLTVVRGWWGSTAASHASGASVLVDPRFTFVDILDAINEALGAVFPLVYRDIVDETLTTTATTWEYTIPNVSGLATPIPFLHYLGVKEPGDLVFRQRRDWQIIRGATPKIRFPYEPVAGTTIRLEGIAPFTPLTVPADTLDALYPTQAEGPLTTYAGKRLLASGLASRLRYDSGATDRREEANTISGQAQVVRQNLQDFYTALNQCALPPRPKHLRRVF